MPPAVTLGIRGGALAILALPASVLALALGLLWLLGLLCGKERRKYITSITENVTNAMVQIFRGLAASPTQAAIEQVQDPTVTFNATIGQSPVPVDDDQQLLPTPASER
jgi:hypothetical protein